MVNSSVFVIERLVKQTEQTIAHLERKEQEDEFKPLVENLSKSLELLEDELMHIEMEKEL